MSVEIIEGDSRLVLKELADSSIDSVVTDPPYALTSGKKSTTGFMGKAWDNPDTAFDPAFWAEVYRVLKPGGYVLAFGGTRTYHRLACAIEDAGFEIRDQVGWAYGSGFPKSHNVGKAIEAKILTGGSGPKNIRQRDMGDDYRPHELAGTPNYGDGRMSRGADTDRDYKDVPDLTTPEAQQWDGWGTALKPAWEPICMARKPLSSLPIPVRDIVEAQLRERGVEGEIRWTSGPASGAARQNQSPSSSSTDQPRTAATSVSSAVAKGMPNGEPLRPNSFEKHGIAGLSKTPVGSENYPAAPTENSAIKSSTLMGESAPAAEKPSEYSSPSITSTVEGQSTEKPFTAKSMENSDASATPPGIEFFAGIATGLTGSAGRALINRNADGSFVWPDGLPVAVPAQSLTVAENVLAHGTGALNIDGCRVETDDALGGGDQAAKIKVKTDGWDRPWMQDTEAKAAHAARVNENVAKAEALGRWPANLIHDGSDEVIAAFPQARGQIADASSSSSKRKTQNTYGAMNRGNDGAVARDLGGSAARFFYCAKASKADRDDGMTTPEKPVVTFATANGTSGKPSSISEGRETAYRNTHPTVKPTDLMRYLCRLVTPPGGTVLDPFMGSGSTGRGAVLEGFSFVGIEMMPEYFEIADARIAAAEAKVVPKMQAAE